MWIFSEDSVFAAQPLGCAFFMEEIMRNTWYAALVFGAGACYGVLSTCVKLAYGHGFDLSDVSGAQYFYGMTLLWLAVVLRVRQSISLRTIGQFLLLGLPMAMTTMCYYKSLETLSASLAVVFLFQSIWMGSAAECIRRGQRPSGLRCFSVVLTLFGTAMAANLLEDYNHFSFQPGMLWGLLAALCYTIEIVCLNCMGRDVPPLCKSALMSTGAAVITFSLLPPLFLTSFSHFVNLAPFGIVLGLFGVALPPLLLSTGMPHISPGLGSLLAASELPVALLLSLLILGESLSIFQGIGIVLILLGIFLGNRE